MKNEKIENQKINQNDLEKTSGGYATQTTTTYSMINGPYQYGTWGNMPSVEKLYLTEKELEFLRKKHLVTSDNKLCYGAPYILCELYDAGFRETKDKNYHVKLDIKN